MDRANRHRMSAKLFPEGVYNPLDTKDLGPRLQELESKHPTWPVSDIPRWKHSRFGFTCNRMSRKGLTKRVGWRNQDNVLRELEACRCGARRQVLDGVPEHGWNDINAARKHPDWPTIQQPTS